MGQGGPPAAPPAAGGAPPGPGASPAATPVPNRGAQAGGLPKIQIAIKIVEAARIGMPAGTDAWRDFGKAMELMAKHVPQGEVSRGVEKTELERLQMQQRQSAANTAMMRGMPGGQPPQQPMPAA
jgi:hypothetical protein